MDKLVIATTLNTSVLLAYLLLEDMRALKPRNWVTQNG